MKDLYSIPTAPRALPLVGHLPPLLRDPLAFLTSLPAHGKLVRIRLGPVPLVVICDPEFTHHVLVDDRVFDKGGPIWDRAREVMGNGIGSCPHSAHRRLRRLSQPAFHSDRLAAYSQTMTACIDEEIRSWRAGQVLDLPTVMMKITFKVMGATLFSGALSSRELTQLIGDVKTIFDGIYQRMFLLPPLDRLPTPNNRAYLRSRARLRDTCDRVIAERRADGTDHGDLLSALVAAHDPEDGARGMTNAEISDTIVTFSMAGAETGALTLAWALDLLSRDTKIERRLHAEVDTVLAGAPPTYADVPRLVLTERIVTETLRLRPPAWFLTRRVAVDTRLGGYLLPAGTSVVYSPYLIHHRSDLYDNSEVFAPDRWAPQRPKPPRNAFVPFGAGARKCIGEAFGMTETVLALAAVTARWRLEHLPGHKRVRPSLGAALRPRELRMRVVPRTATPAVDSSGHAAWRTSP